MNTVRVSLLPGQRGPLLVDDEDPDGSGGVALIVGEVTPTVVYPPDEVGGGERKVLGTFEAGCPLHDHKVRHYDLGNDLGVAECVQAGFLWYDPRSAAR